MKTLFKNLGKYFARLFRALLNQPDYEMVVLTKEEEFYSFLEQNKNRIKYLMEHYSNNTKKNDKLKEELGLKNQAKSTKFRPIKMSKKLARILNIGEDLKNRKTQNNFGVTGNVHGDSIMRQIEELKSNYYRAIDIANKEDELPIVEILNNK